MNTTYDLLAESAKKHPNSIALIEGAVSTSYELLLKEVNSMASYLTTIGIENGSKVGIYVPNSRLFVIAFFSVAKLGAVSVPIDNVLKLGEVRFFVKHAGLDHLITETALEPLAREAVSGLSTRVVAFDLDWIDANIDRGALTNASDQDNEVGVDDDAIYLYSTGSTGEPKRVARSHRNLVALADNHTSTVGWAERDTILFVLPLSHTYAFGNFISAVKIGSTLVLMREFNRSEVVNSISKHSVTIFPAVPFILDILSRSKVGGPADLSSLELVISAGAPLSRDTFEGFYKRYGIYPHQLYGSTETGVIAINLAPDIESRWDSVGRPVNNVEVRVVGDDGEPRGVDELGEITVRSPSMTTGYYGLEEETKQVFRGGFYYTGDLGRIDSEGFIYIVGRKKLFINLSGNKVDPVEVENVLLSCAGVTDAAVYGVSDQKGGEVVKAALVVEGDVETGLIIEQCRERLADYKVPRFFEYIDQIPRSPTGKILREKLK